MINYICAECGAEGVKLWREYQTIAPRLLCAHCASIDQFLPYTIHPDGTHYSDLGQTDQIGWFVPAVPDVEMENFWGYTSVPAVRYLWWRELPNAMPPAPQPANP